MRLKVIIIAGAILAGGTGLGAAGAASAAPALPRGVPPSAGCSGGIYEGYCGTQTDITVPARAIAVAVRNAYIKLPPQEDLAVRGVTQGGIGFQYSPDFIWLRYDHGTTWVAIYAPNGIPTDYALTAIHCAAGPQNPGCPGTLENQKIAALAPATGAPDQQWTATAVEGGYTWTNLATGDIMEIGGNPQNPEGSWVYTVPAPVTPTPNEIFNFTSSSG